MRHDARSGSMRSQRGAALLIAMIIVTLVATLASAMVWQQWRAVQVESAERARAQSAWILSGALDFGLLILKETARAGKPVTLNDPWATPLAEARLSTFLAVDKSNPDDGPEAFLAGNVSDAQARYNLRNLVAAGKVVDAERDTLMRLCQGLGLDVGIAQRIADGLRDALASQTKSTPIGLGQLVPTTVAQLAWLGVDPLTVKALEPYVVLLPTLTPTKVNVNTASKEVLAAVTGLVSAAHLVQFRQRTPFKDIATFAEQSTVLIEKLTNVGVQSDFFEIRGRLRLADHVLVERSLVQRDTNGRGFKVIYSERIASLEQIG